MYRLAGNERDKFGSGWGLPLLMVIVATFATWGNLSFAKTGKQGRVTQETFKSPETAVETLVAAAKANDEQRLMSILGHQGKFLISSGDPIADQQGRARFVQRYEQKSRLVNGRDRTVVLEIGDDLWPLPIPIVVKGGGWVFDTGKGKEEILNRRIGLNELSAIQVCLAYVDAQREYAEIMRSTEGRVQYAEKFLSDPGKRDGLYWESSEGQPPSPLGPLVAAARKEGYRRSERNEPTPYHGYVYRILKAQGAHAPAGSRDYVVDGKMVAGFALVAHPARFGASGIMTFMVSEDGVVYEKNLGRKTEIVVQRMDRFDPDRSWHKVDSKYLSLSSKGN